jgi:hypothetical protein
MKGLAHFQRKVYNNYDNVKHVSAIKMKIFTSQ